MCTAAEAGVDAAPDSPDETSVDAPDEVATEAAADATEDVTVEDVAVDAPVVQPEPQSEASVEAGEDASVDGGGARPDSGRAVDVDANFETDAAFNASPSDQSNNSCSCRAVGASPDGALLGLSSVGTLLGAALARRKRWRK
jgi:hypothetical protein